MVHSTDANHVEIAGYFRELGCSVADTSDAGGGFPDLVVGVTGVNLLVEVKTDTGRLKTTQEHFIEIWRGQYCIVRTRADVIELVRAARELGRHLYPALRRHLNPK